MKTIVHAMLDCFYKEGFGYQENILPAKHKAMGYDVHIITFNQGGDASCKSGEPPVTYNNTNGIPVHILANNPSFFCRIPGIVGWIDSTIGLETKLEEIRPDIIFIHGICKHDNLHFVRYKDKHPEVCIYADNHSDYYNSPVNTLKEKYNRYIIGRYIGKRIGAVAEKVWGVTPWRVEYLKDVYGIPAEKVSLLVMGGDEEVIQWEKRDTVRLTIRQRMSIPEDSFLVISGGKIDKAKNAHRLIEAVRQLSTTHNIQLLLFGKAEKDMEEYLAGIKDPVIHNVGWISPNEANDYYLASDLACFPGTHSVLWEQACACGIPAVFKDWNGGFAHVDIGGNCILLKDTSVSGIAHCIELLLTDKTLYEKMRYVAANKGRLAFSYSTIAKKAIDLIPFQSQKQHHRNRQDNEPYMSTINTQGGNVSIAVIITCFNRKEKTIQCLRHLFVDAKQYNAKHGDGEKVHLSIFLTDDGCTDGTADEVREECRGQQLHIIHGNGHCYWAGGMRLAWGEALKRQDVWDYYLLLNDDTMMSGNAFDELFKTHHYVMQNTGKPGIYSGMVSDVNDVTRITYSGAVYDNASKSQYHKVMPKGKPLKVDITNANILLVPREIVSRVGIFHEGYIHGGADYDYAMTVARYGYSAFITEKVCGQCEYDHKRGCEIIADFRQMSFRERCQYVHHPVHGDHDYLLYLKRQIPHKYPISWLLHKIRLFAPSVYEMICRKRGLEEYQK